MLRFKSMASLTLDEARVLLEATVATYLFGTDLDDLEHPGKTPIIDALVGNGHQAELLRERLTGLFVTLLDINRAIPRTLARIPGLLPLQIENIVKAQPYFSLGDLPREGEDLREIAQLAGPYLTHEGYTFIDKPQGHMVELIPDSVGVIVRFREGTAPMSIDALLQSVGLLKKSHDSDERILLCFWGIPLTERPKRLRNLKEKEIIESVAPCLRDIEGELRFPLPNQLDLALHHGADQTDWDRITRKYRFHIVRQYTEFHRSLRVECEPHDLGALYRTLRELATEPVVHFAEPTYLIVNDL